jgi:hypothetical protein
MWTQADREIHRETRKRYPSDLSDGEWALTIPFFATYRPLSATIRAIVEACLSLVAEGCRGSVREVLQIGLRAGGHGRLAVSDVANSEEEPRHGRGPG